MKLSLMKLYERTHVYLRIQNALDPGVLPKDIYLHLRCQNQIIKMNRQAIYLSNDFCF